jgi:hypothetical protein
VRHPGSKSVNRGRVDAVRLIELLSTIGRHKQSGLLTLTSRRESVTLVIADGSVRSVSTNDPALRIGQVLIQLELITEEQIEQALALQSIATDPERIGEVLVDVGYITEADVGTAMATQIASGLGIMFNEDSPIYEFVYSDNHNSGIVQPEIVHDPLILTILHLSEQWLGRNSFAWHEHSPEAWLNGVEELDTDPDCHPVQQRLHHAHQLVTNIADDERHQDAHRVKQSLDAILAHLREHLDTGEPLPGQEHATDAGSRPLYRVHLIDRNVDIWSLSDLTRAARHLLLGVLNGESRLEVLLRDIKTHTPRPQRVVRELTSRELIHIETVEVPNPGPEAGRRGRRDRMMVLRLFP